MRISEVLKQLLPHSKCLVTSLLLSTVFVEINSISNKIPLLSHLEPMKFSSVTEAGVDYLSGIYSLPCNVALKSTLLL